jgi:hypothetical protein
MNEVVSRIFPIFLASRFQALAARLYPFPLPYSLLPTHVVLTTLFSPAQVLFMNLQPSELVVLELPN